MVHADERWSYDSETCGDRRSKKRSPEEQFVAADMVQHLALISNHTAIFSNESKKLLDKINRAA